MDELDPKSLADGLSVILHIEDIWPSLAAGLARSDVYRGGPEIGTFPDRC